MITTTAATSPVATYFEEVGDEVHLRHVAVVEETQCAAIEATMERLSFSIGGFDAPTTR